MEYGLSVIALEKSSNSIICYAKVFITGAPNKSGNEFRNRYIS